MVPENIVLYLFDIKVIYYCKEVVTTGFEPVQANAQNLDYQVFVRLSKLRQVTIKK